MSKDKTFADGLAEMVSNNPKLKEALNGKNDVNHFIEAYPLEIPNIMSKVEGELDTESASFLIMYTRVLKSYASGNDSRFMMDFLLYGSDLYEKFKRNQNQIVKALLLRGSQIRTMLDVCEDMDSDTFMDIYGRSIEIWALSDTLELQYGSFLPVRISKLVIELQTDKDA